MYTYGLVQCTSLKRFVHISTAYVAASLGDAPIAPLAVEDFDAAVLDRVVPMLGIPPFGGRLHPTTDVPAGALLSPASSGASDDTVTTVGSTRCVGSHQSPVTSHQSVVGV